MSAGKVLLGALAGVAAGAVLGILFAPAKGSKTRRKISKKGENIVEELKDKLDEFVESITDKFEEVKEEVSDLTEKGKHKFEEAKKL